MNKVLLANKDIEYLLRWRDEHKDLVRRADCPLKVVQIVCENGITLTAARDGGEVSIAVVNNGSKVGKLYLRFLPFGMISITKDKTGLPDEDVQSIITVYASLMAFLVHSGCREVSDRPNPIRTPTKVQPTKHKTKKSSGITYIMHRKGNNARLAPQGSHASPSGVFSVRGHYRRYKSGKIVWIEEYKKGEGKQKSKTYKLGQGDDNV